MTTYDGAIGDARKRLAQTPTDTEIGPQIAADEFADVRATIERARYADTVLGHRVRDLLAALGAARAEVERLAHWKDEALSVIVGLQVLGNELGIGLGEQVTGPRAAEVAADLRARAEDAEVKLAEVRHYLEHELSHQSAGRVYEDLLAVLDGTEGA